jgi:hypothetical protein
MQIQIYGQAVAKFSDVPTGTFFRALRAEPLFGLSVSDGKRKSALIFSRSPGQSGNPWLADDGLPNDAIVIFPEATLRASTGSVAPVSGSFPFGAVINSRQKYYIKASAGTGYTATFNLSSGMYEQLSDKVAAVIYPIWQIGFVANNLFEPIFSFPTAG